MKIYILLVSLFFNSQVTEAYTENIKFTHNPLINLLILASNENEDYPRYTVPSWVAIEYPEILDYDTGTSYNPYGIEIIADKSLETLPSYKVFDSTLNDLFEGHWDEGTIYRSFYSAQHRMRDMLSFAPEKLNLSKDELPVQDLKNESLERWAFLSPWNFNKYQSLKQSFNALSKELQNYYLTNIHLKNYAPFSANYLNAYVKYNFEAPVDVASEKAFQVFSKPNQSLEILKNLTKDFSMNDWNAALSYAILNHYSIDILEWIINSGADINAKVDGETPLMKAADEPDILSFLIKKGANLEETTDFGKTAIFYAIQFNNLKSVKILVESGANINVVLNKNENNNLWDLHKVKGFTPLAYSIRYGLMPLSSYLIHKGASLKGVSIEDLKQWMKVI